MQAVQNPATKTTLDGLTRATIVTEDVDRPSSSEGRTDGWENYLTGIGTWSKDKAQHLEFQRPKYIITLDWARLQSMYHYDPLSRKIVDVWPKHAFRRGWTLHKRNDPQNNDFDLEMSKEDKRLQLRAKLREGMTWGRLYGGALVILGIKDGATDLALPVNEDSIRSIDYINVQDRRFITVEMYYADLAQPNYGQPAVYRVFRTLSDARNPKDAKAGSFYDIHESRVLRFEGETVDLLERQILGGWSHSCLNTVYEEIKRFMQTFQTASHLLTDASQGVYKLKGLMQQLATDTGKKLLNTRMAMMDMARSVARSLLLDADGEEYQRIQTSFQSVPDMLDRFMQMLSMVTGVPVTLLMGRSPAGMNATGDSDFRSFYDEVNTFQIAELQPKLERFYKLSMLAADGPTGGEEEEIIITFHSLWNPSDKEKAETNFVQAQADNLYVMMGALSAEEVANSRFKNGEVNLTTTIDMKAREEAMKAGLKFDPHPNEPDPEPTDGGAPGGGLNGPAGKSSGGSVRTGKQQKSKPKTRTR